MPEYYARGISIYLKRYGAGTDTHESDGTGVPEQPIEHDGYRTRFIGPLDDMPLFLATVTRDRMDTPSPVQGLELTVDFTKAAKSCRTFDGSRDLKIEVFLNGDLVACRFRAAATSPTAIEVFSGRRVGKRFERPWILNLEPKAIPVDHQPTAKDFMTEQVLRQQWVDVSRNFRNQALERGTSEKGRIPFSAEYLHSLSTLPLEDVFDASVLRNRGHTPVKPSFIDIVISYGEGHKMEQLYISEPQLMEDAAYKTENNGLSKDRYQTGSVLVHYEQDLPEGTTGNPSAYSRPLKHSEARTIGQPTAAEAQTRTTTSAFRATTPPNNPVNQLSLDRSPFKSTFHVVGNVNQGTAMISPERMKHLKRAVVKHSPEKPLSGGAIEDATRSLNHLSAGQHIEKMQQEPPTAPIPVTPHKRRQSAAEFVEETSRCKKARLDDTETETSPSAVMKSRRTIKAQKLRQTDQPPKETEGSLADTPVLRFSTPASALSRFGFNSKPKSQKLKFRGKVDVVDGGDVPTKDAAIKRIDSAAILPGHTPAEGAVRQNDKGTPVRSVKTRSSASTQKQQLSVKKSREDSVWPPQSSRDCAVTYMDAKLCGLSEREYHEALLENGNSPPFLSNVVKKERAGDFQEKGIVCGVRYVIF